VTLQPHGRFLILGFSQLASGETQKQDHLFLLLRLCTATLALQVFSLVASLMSNDFAD
jgi:hypothetical protein